MSVCENRESVYRGMRKRDEVGVAYLHFHVANRALFAQTLRSGRVVIGRSDACDLALPGEDISRVHAIVERRGEEWWITDRSRHGTRVNGAPVDRQILEEGDSIQIGRYHAKFWPHGDSDRAGPTATAPLWSGQPEELVEADSETFTTTRAVLRVVRGPLEGNTWDMKRSRIRVGGTGADWVIDPSMPKDALAVRVARGRVMLEPGSLPARLAGQPVRELTPALRGEQIDLGPHAIVVDVEAIRETKEADGFGEMVGTSQPMRALFGVLGRLARHEYPVLLLGESGTGKELAGRALHSQSLRCGGPFVAVNCAAIASTLFESELFGHEKGSFTGADQARDGAFQRAQGGVLFLDEIGELGLDEQAKLLRALEPGGEVRRVGAANPTHPDVRVVAATNRDLAAMVRAGAFRGDLYHRLNMLTVRLPPLRERRDDIIPLAESLLQRNHPGAALSEDGKEALKKYHWPGNVRELRNVLTRAVVLGGEHITAQSLAFFPDSFDPAGPSGAPAPSGLPGGAINLADLDPLEIERAQLVAALDEASGNRAKAARILGIPRSSLLYKLKRFGISR